MMSLRETFKGKVFEVGVERFFFFSFLFSELNILMNRWTDGKQWSNSANPGDFLLYKVRVKEVVWSN